MKMKQIWPVLKDYTMMTVGAVLVAASINLFFVPNNVVTGGIMGVAMMLYSFFGLPIGVVTLAANIPLFIIGWRQLGGFMFGVRTLYATVVVSVAIDLLAPFMHSVTKDPLLYILYGALLDGIGVGLVFRARGTTGGIDILARLLEQRFGIQPGRSLLVMNIVVFGGAFFSYGSEPVLYAILAAFIGSFVLDYTLAAGGSARQALIISSKPEAVTHALLHDLGRGVTMLEGKGGYTGDQRAVLLCVVSRNEISFVKNIVSAADPHAFLIIGDVSEVLGEGFRTFAHRPEPQPAVVSTPALATGEEKAV
ncbi:YitT family protein [Chloroflexia bacterium SDU3-3]|nr:YitT family protein [Chloroflexia bacterium SDU3-3]